MKAKEFDKMFDEGKDVSEYVDYSNEISEEELLQYAKLNSQKITISLSPELKNKLEKKAKETGLKLNDLIKAVLAKEVGLI